MGAITPEQRENAQKQYKAYEAEYRKLVGLQDREPEPFPVVDKVSAKFLGDNYNDPKAHEDFRKQFGEEQYQARVAQIESAMEAAKKKKQSRAAEAKKQSAPSLKDRYSKDVNLFEQAAGAVKRLSDKMSNQYRKDFLVQIENRVNDIIAIMKSGEEVPKGMLKLLNTAEQMPWIDHETKVLLNEVYANAVGKTAQEYPARED
ncbi:MAG TPA: hypothetical protein DCZ12_17235 [Gammaproteobacteria bacterium]|nr:hypothetical protein [Gammaproteobacteria bacterium]